MVSEKEAEALRTALETDYGANIIVRPGTPHEAIRISGYTERPLQHSDIQESCVRCYKGIGFSDEPVYHLDVLAEVSGPGGRRQILSGSYGKRFFVNIVEL